MLAFGALNNMPVKHVFMKNIEFKSCLTGDLCETCVYEILEFKSYSTGESQLPCWVPPLPSCVKHVAPRVT